MRLGPIYFSQRRIDAKRKARLIDKELSNLESGGGVGWSGVGWGGREGEREMTVKYPNGYLVLNAIVSTVAHQALNFMDYQLVLTEIDVMVNIVQLDT